MIGRKPRTAEDGEGAKRILVIQLGGLGAFVSALAAAKQVREAHFGDHITLLTTDAMAALAQACPYFDAVETDGKPTDAQSITRLIARIRAAKYDVVYDFEGSSRTNNYFQGLRPWPPRWIGPVGDANAHRLDRYGAQLEGAGISVGAGLMPDLSWVRGALRDPPRLQPEYFGLRGGPYVLLLPRGGGDEASRRWPAEKFAELARRVAGFGVTPVVLGETEERPAGAAIAAAEPRARNLVTRADVFQCIALAERAAFAVGENVELMQVVAAAGTPSLVFLPALDAPEIAAPRGAGGVVAFTASSIADIPVEQVERQLRNSGVLLRAVSA